MDIQKRNARWKFMAASPMFGLSLLESAALMETDLTSRVLCERKPSHTGSDVEYYYATDALKELCVEVKSRFTEDDVRANPYLRAVRIGSEYVLVDSGSIKQNLLSKLSDFCEQNKSEENRAFCDSARATLNYVWNEQERITRRLLQVQDNFVCTGDALKIQPVTYQRLAEDVSLDRITVSRCLNGLSVSYKDFIYTEKDLVPGAEVESIKVKYVLNQMMRNNDFYGAHKTRKLGNVVDWKISSIQIADYMQTHYNLNANPRTIRKCQMELNKNSTR